MPEFSRFEVAVVGGGPAGLMAADVLSAAGARVTVYDRMPSLGRKFLMAGRGGLNLTHSEQLAAFITRYGVHAEKLKPAIEAMSPDTVRAWCEDLGQATFVGSSGRVFPKTMKTSPLLRAWLRRLAERGVAVRLRHHWQGWTSDGALSFATPSGEQHAAADATILALGGASWPALGADGSWVDPVRAAGAEIVALQPSNCGVTVEWSAMFRGRFAGEPLKRIALTIDGESVRGEAMVTASGLEGGAVYALSAPIRAAVASERHTDLLVDLRPDIDAEALAATIASPRGKQSLATFLRKAAQLSPVAIGLLNEHAHRVGTPLATLSAGALAALVKAVPVPIAGTAGMARAISTAGGVAWGSLDERFMLAARPGTFVAGEMIDWDAPTGGYLLQGCFATGAAAARGALAWLSERSKLP